MGKKMLILSKLVKLNITRYIDILYRVLKINYRNSYFNGFLIEYSIKINPKIANKKRMVLKTIENNKEKENRSNKPNSVKTNNKRS
jgi:hypothetical protein